MCPQVLTGTDKKVTDTTSTETKVKWWKDTTIVFAADTASIWTMVKCDTNGVLNMPEVTLKKKHSVITAKITNNKLDAECICPELEKTVALQEKTITQLRERNEVDSKTNTVTVQYIPGWVKCFAWIGGIGSLLALVLIIIKFIK